jgi:hypothetical protein
MKQLLFTLCLGIVFLFNQPTLVVADELRPEVKTLHVIGLDSQHRQQTRIRQVEGGASRQGCTIPTPHTAENSVTEQPRRIPL